MGTWSVLPPFPKLWKSHWNCNYLEHTLIKVQKPKFELFSASMTMSRHPHGPRNPDLLDAVHPKFHSLTRSSQCFLLSPTVPLKPLLFVQSSSRLRARAAQEGITQKRSSRLTTPMTCKRRSCQSNACCAKLQQRQRRTRPR